MNKYFTYLAGSFGLVVLILLLIRTHNPALWIGILGLIVWIGISLHSK